MFHRFRLCIRSPPIACSCSMLAVLTMAFIGVRTMWKMLEIYARLNWFAALATFRSV